ncbi:MAG TPA: hypothetical protein VJ963_13125 [Bacteroidales bacterium]|nr:hypothetical protein [Bacteroidales bacterium]
MEMTGDIRANISNAEMLEKLYRKDRKSFRTSFEKLLPEIENTEAARFWKARFDYDNRTESRNSIVSSEIVKVILICIGTSLLIKIPDILQPGNSFNQVFYEKNTAIILFLGLTTYTLWFRGIKDLSKIVFTFFAFLVPAVYVNLLPSSHPSATVNLVYIHTSLLMWFVYGLVFTGYEYKDPVKRIGFIRYNGDLAIVYALIAVAGGILTIITIGLFETIGLKIGEFYMRNIVLTGAVAAPVVASYLIEKFPLLVSRTASLIALVFSPLVLITLIIFLVSIIVTGKDPYNDRDFLLVFNLMLLGVMAIIIFSVSETSIITNQRFSAVILLALSAVTVIIDLVALSAIFYRLREYGITPNRLSVLISNILVLGNLILILSDLFRINFRGSAFSKVEMTVSGYLPVYLIWIIIVTFGFPLIFGI